MYIFVKFFIEVPSYNSSRISRFKRPTYKNYITKVEHQRKEQNITTLIQTPPKLRATKTNKKSSHQNLTTNFLLPLFHLTVYSHPYISYPCPCELVLYFYKSILSSQAHFSSFSIMAYEKAPLKQQRIIQGS